MSELAADFQSLPPDLQHIIQVIQDRHDLCITPLEQLGGGWSGAVIYLVSVTSHNSTSVEHFVLKLDHKSESARSDEGSRHAVARAKSPPEFARDHLADIAFEPVESDGAIGIFYTIAGQSLQAFRPLSSYSQRHQLEIILSATNHYLLTEWNANLTFARSIHPQELLAKWLSFRLQPGGHVERFIGEMGRADPDRPGFVYQGTVFPNPLWYARQRESWGGTRPIDAMIGLQHGDLNTNNILVKFAADQEKLTGYYLIDFALFKDQMPLLYDLRYLEMSYLILAMSRVSFAKTVELILQLAEEDRSGPRRAPIEMAGASNVIHAARHAFDRWVKKHHPSLQDDLWGQYWLAGVAAGLGYCHKVGLANEQRMGGLVYAAANLKRYTSVFGLPLPTDVQSLYYATSGGAGSQVAFPTGRSVHNLPEPPTVFIGRTAQVAATRELLLRPNTRLVTLTGPGGTGKTRLGLQAAQQVADQFRDGAVFVSLADDTTADQFVSRIAQQLQVREGGSRPLLENLKDYIRDKHLVLVLDNLEQLVSAVPIVADMIATAPGIKVLATSRIALNVRGEHEFPVPPMSLPPATSQLTAKDLAGNESAQLFIERARAVQPSFSLTEDNAAAVAEICRRLDGLPLALELAAARTKLLPPQAILARLDDRLKLLTGGPRDVPARQQTLRNTLEWSYGLLSQDEKILYARLGVFVGGFTLQAAEAVSNSDGRLDVLDGLNSLVNSSLLRREDAGGEPRFSMLETIRAYAVERLGKSGEMAALQQQHAQYFRDVILGKAATELFSTKGSFWLDWLEREHDNIRATLAWYLAAPDGIEIAGALTRALIWFWYRRGYLSEGRMWAERVLSFPALSLPGRFRGLVLHANGMLTMWQGELDAALVQLEESLAIWQRVEEDDFQVAISLMGTGVALVNMGRDSAARPLLDQARVLFEELGLPYWRATVLVHLGNVALGLGNPDAARTWLDRALAQARQIDEDWTLSFVLNNLGEVARTQGQYDAAREYYEESEALLRRSGDKGDLARLVHSLGYIALHEGDYARAEAEFKESLTMFRQLGNKRGIAECLAGFAGLRARQGHALLGATMLGAAEALLQATGGAWWPADRGEVQRNREILRSALDEAEYVNAWENGKALSLDEALRLVEGESPHPPVTVNGYPAVRSSEGAR